MDLSNRYCIYVGTSRGVLQCSYCKPEEKCAFSVPEKQAEITALCWGRSENEIIIGYKNENVEFYDAVNNTYTGRVDNLDGEGSIVGIAPISESVLVAKQDGVISLWNEKNSDHFSINLEEKSTLDAIYYNSHGNAVGTGGEFNDFKLWDIETKQCLFKAKSLGHDELNLPIPTSIRGIISLSSDEKLNACATKEGHVLLYDERAQRRPVVTVFNKKVSYTCIADTFRNRQCLVGTTKGYIELLDLKAPGRCLKTFTSFTGSVTDIVCDPQEPIIATTSLDRYLRVHHLETKDTLYKVYLKQSLSKILMRHVVKEEAKEEKAETAAEELDDIFCNMETIIEGSKRKKHKNGKTTSTGKKKKRLIDENHLVSSKIL